MEFFDIKFQHDMKELRGYIDDFLDEKFYSKINRDDYFKFTLLDEEVLDAKKKLSMIYPNIMILEFDNKFTRELNSSYSKNYEKDKTLLEHFCDFYKIQTGEDIDDKKFDIVKSMAEKIERNDCAPD